MKINKKLSAIVLSATVLMYGSTSALAASAWGNFSVSLPKSQGDTEVDRIARADGSNAYFAINIKSVSGGYNAVRAWTENTVGSNYSNPYNTYRVSTTSTNTRYDVLPSKGANVVLNLDNPVSTTNTPTVEGKWTPN